MNGYRELHIMLSMRWQDKERISNSTLKQKSASSVLPKLTEENLHRHKQKPKLQDPQKKSSNNLKRDYQ